jgi:hypothetical protein
MLQSILFGWLVLYVARKVVCCFAWGKKFDEYLARSGVTISLFHIAYETNYLNSVMFSWFNQTNKRSRELLSYWFDCGVFIMAIGQLASVVILSFALLKSLLRMLPDIFSNTDSEKEGSSDPIITPIIPGVNFPARFLLDFWICTFIVIVIHEFGHAAAASMERLQIQGCGTFFLLLFPGEAFETHCHS